MKRMLVRYLYNLKKREKTPMERCYLKLLHGSFPRFLNGTNYAKQHLYLSFNQGCFRGSKSSSRSYPFVNTDKPWKISLNCFNTCGRMNGIQTVARPDSGPKATSPRTHPRQTVGRWTLTRKTVALPDTNSTGQ